ncbi:hypothetical protein QBC37DRAFT_380960 [Rhypophila decipiens]|uniref:Uncharacterized protein n=1 Tax=Rhypophila decipiens TaxID=261697 RepID=A0AAN6XTD8_9PEZI|nr:hypothetical protein QBC37DRAFT_380960 [Rhypophila decipiens]
MMRSASLILGIVAALLFGRTFAQRGVCSAVTDTCFIDGTAWPCTIGSCSEEGVCFRENNVGVFPPQWNTVCQ